MGKVILVMHRQIFLTWLLCRWSVRGIEPLLVDSNNGKLPKASQSHRNTAKSDRNQQPQSPPIGSSSLKQKLDHFNSNDRREWLQYYMHRKSPYQSPDGAVFLVVSGEDEADRNWLANERLPHVELADRINASIFLLEHRFYGTSRPTNDTSIENLKYLNARQATKDIDGFVKEVNRREKLTNPKWITFGGSYSGSLAAWAREKHPRTIRAAVASSAPLQAKLNFKGMKF
ncbi:unnamed protein product [Litomosoides sigmodontis]|uniref:Serine carboxypeptidase S28 n=1 Tax=Litomosoides sigmodontis TaxID=42156 RepID=A0A3P6T249_LITSI|nr:unnamed protein product [Litomosoides sigmodontis]